MDPPDICKKRSQAGHEGSQEREKKFVATYRLVQPQEQTVLHITWEKIPFQELNGSSCNHISNNKAGSAALFTCVFVYVRI